jgi:hypothetical protein
MFGKCYGIVAFGDQDDVTRGTSTALSRQLTCLGERVLKSGL